MQRRFTMKVARNPAYRRYARRIAASGATYLFGIWLAVVLLDKHAPVSVGAVAIALLPGLAVVGMIWAVARLLVELDDEYLRMIEIRKALIGSGFALSVASVWGILELFTQIPRLEVFWMFPIWSAGVALGAIWSRLTIGDAGCA